MMKSALTAGNDTLLSAAETSGCAYRPMALGHSVAFTCRPQFRIIDASHQDESPPAGRVQTLRKQNRCTAQPGAGCPLQLTETQRDVRRLARQFAKAEITPYAAQWDRDAAFPMEAIHRMAKAGLLGMTAPKQFGGSGADSVALALAVEEIARADASSALVLSMANSLSILLLMRYGTAAQQQRFLPEIVTGASLACFTMSEPHAGSNAAKMRTRAIRKGDRYVISGTKQFITTGSVSRLAFVFAVTEPGAGIKGISCFLVPTDTRGFRVVRRESKLGLRASDTCQIALDDVEVAADQMLGTAGEGYRIALNGLGASRIGVAAQAVGVAQAAFTSAAAYAREREAFEKKLIEHQGIAFKLADMATEIKAARLLTLHAAALKDADAPYATASAMAKVFAAEMSERVCSAALQVFGGYGYMKDYPIEKLYRDARVFQIYEGTSEIQRILISRAIAEDRLEDDS
jgi:butyryl-CoA dehydrogenase